MAQKSSKTHDQRLRSSHPPLKFADQHALLVANPSTEGLEPEQFGARSKIAVWNLMVWIMPGVKLDGYNCLSAALKL